MKKDLKLLMKDIKHWNDYDYIVINKNLEVCFKQIENIILNKKKLVIFLINLSNFIIHFWFNFCWSKIKL